MGLLSYLFAATYDSALARMEAGALGARRVSLLASASGAVLEVGAGTGVNVRHYQQLQVDAQAAGRPPPLTRLVLVEPSPPMRSRLTARVDAAVATEAADGRPPAACLPPVEVVASGLPALPYPDSSFDTVVLFLVLCSVGSGPALDAAVVEVRRLLAPGGRLLVMEHVPGVDGSALAAQQARWNGVWGWTTDGCSLLQPTDAALRRGGFASECLAYEAMGGGGSGGCRLHAWRLGL